ncbi:hypothetical protein BHE74_00030648, partial [Ensete ventricosum]
IYVPTNPRGAERLPPGIIVPESDFYLRRLWGNPDEVGRVHLHCFMSCTPLFAIPQVPLLMQNDLVHGWGLDFALRKCVEVRERCRKEWGIFRKRLSEAEKAYYLSKGITSPNSTGV